MFNKKYTLENFDHTTIEFIPCRKEFIYAKVIDVYDGDTCTILYEYENIFLKTKIRINGVDTPEKRIKGPLKNTDIGNLQKKAAIHVKNDVVNLLENKIVKVVMNKFDKYGGRVNGDIYLPEECNSNKTLADYLISKKYAKKYSGKKKELWTEKELLFILEN
jgi:endonuclease YncB( thermonuclease family)